MTTSTTSLAEPRVTQTFALAGPAPVANLPAPIPAPVALPSQASRNALSDAHQLKRDAFEAEVPYRAWGVVSGLVGTGLIAWSSMSALSSMAGSDAFGTGSLITFGLGIAAAIGGPYLWGRPPKMKQQAKDALDASIAAIAKEMPVPPANASPEERLTTAWLAAKVLHSTDATAGNEQTTAYVGAILGAGQGVTDAQRQLLKPILKLVFDGQGKPVRYCRSIDILGERIRRLPADVRTRLVKVLEGSIAEAIRGQAPDPSPWRRQALADALEGKEFRYGSLVTGQANQELPPMHPDRMRYEQINDSLDEQLKYRARQGESALFAKATIPPEMGEQQAFRLAAQYEALGYRAYLHPNKQQIFMTVTTANDIPDGGYIESDSSSNMRLTRLEG